MKKGVVGKGIVVGIIMLFVGTSVVSGFNTNSTNNPQPMNRSWLYVGGSGPGNYTKIQDAIDNASNGDTVFVYDDSSPYYENIVVNKSINLIGEDRNTTVIDGNGSGDVVLITVDWVNLSGFTIQNSGPTQNGIWLKNSDNNGINKNKISQNYYGIFMFPDSNNAVISDNIIFNNSVGINIQNYSANNNIIRNTINFNQHGINLNAYNTTISWNNFSFNIHHSVYIDSCSKCYILNNIINSTNVDGIRCYSSNRNVISNNTISNNGQDGIFIWASYDNTILGNLIIKSEKGIELSDLNNNIISDNTIASNAEFGIYHYNSSGNTIIRNNFLQNRINAFFFNSKNTWNQNYWGRPHLLPKPILGKIKIESRSLTIPWLNFDWHPALKQYEV